MSQPVNENTDDLSKASSERRPKNFELRSELTQEIISKKPDFIERGALYVFLLILLILLSITWFVKYPDTIMVRIVLTSDNAPKEIIPHQDGRLLKLFIKNDDRVFKNEILGWIESTADNNSVLQLSTQVDSSVALLDSGRFESISPIFNKTFNSLGEVQQGYATFTTALQLFNDYSHAGFFIRKKSLLKNDIETLNRSNNVILKQKSLAEQDLALAEESYNMDKILFDQKVLSKEDLRSEKSKFLNKQMTITQLDASLLSNETQVESKEKEIEQLDHDIAQQLTIFREALHNLKSLINDWKKRFILQSPIDGRAAFIVQLQENQFVQSGKVLGYINPEDNHFFGETILPQANFGKIETNLPVQLRFDAYPYEEAGYVSGTISYISRVPSDSGFLARIRLDHGLTTNNNKQLAYKTGLKANGVIITKNMRLLERFYYSIIRSTSPGNK